MTLELLGVGLHRCPYLKNKFLSFLLWWMLWLISMAPSTAAGAVYTNDNTNYPQRCELHKTDNDVNIVESTCTSCNDLYYIKYGNLCTGCQTMVIERHVKESRIRDVLTAANIKFRHDEIVDKMCSKRRPDFVIDCGRS